MREHNHDDKITEAFVAELAEIVSKLSGKKLCVAHQIVIPLIDMALESLAGSIEFMSKTKKEKNAIFQREIACVVTMVTLVAKFAEDDDTFFSSTTAKDAH